MTFGGGTGDVNFCHLACRFGANAWEEVKPCCAEARQIINLPVGVLTFSYSFCLLPFAHGTMWAK